MPCQTSMFHHSAIEEAMAKKWIFGPDICDVWHSLDVLGTTGSILNLCVISLDRLLNLLSVIFHIYAKYEINIFPLSLYPSSLNFLTCRYWAITDPMTYPAKMTDNKACILILIVWICSSAISFPAIAWWRVTAPPINETLHSSGKLRK